MLNIAQLQRQEEPFELPPSGQASFAKPQPRRSLGRAILSAQRPLRAAVATLAELSVENTPAAKIFDCTVLGPGAAIEASQLRLAWLLVNACFVHAVSERREQLASLTDGSAWFFGGHAAAEKMLGNLSPFCIRAADQALSSVRMTRELWDLYPYVIEPQGHVSRSCLQNEASRNVRKSKKAEGVYYTPSDVADFLVSELAKSSPIKGAWIDPACGTGVFIRSIIRHGKRTGATGEAASKFIQENVFGIDKSALATDSCAFVMLAELNGGAFNRTTPFESWKRLKRNIACMDSLNLAPDSCNTDLFSKENNERTLAAVFPESKTVGFHYLVMNPPYAVSNDRDVERGAWLALEGGKNVSADLHLAFTEMMWRLGSIAAAAAVLPLSIATNTTRVYARVRKAFIESSGRKDMLFFDREPQALFGEDIKTRNAILFRFASCPDSLQTSQLLKWTAPQREQIFTREKLVSLSPRLCETSVPKLGSAHELCAYETLRSNTVDLIEEASLSRRTLEQLVSGHRDDSSSISIGTTAYNFLNVFFSSDFGRLATGGDRLSSSPTIFLRFPEEETALAAYALLTSRLAFWMWRVEGDGFHVNSEFIKRLPFWHLLSDKSLVGELAEHGRDIRSASIGSAAKSVNAGRATFSFHCGFERPSSRMVENLALTHLIGNTRFSTQLDSAIHAITSIDGKTRRAANMEF